MPPRKNLKSHIKDVHDRIRDHVCSECGYATARKGSLDNHMLTVHKIGDARFKCEFCPFVSSHKGNFKSHIKSIHDHEEVKRWKDPRLSLK